MTCRPLTVMQVIAVTLLGSLLRLFLGFSRRCFYLDTAVSNTAHGLLYRPIPDTFPATVLAGLCYRSRYSSQGISSPASLPTETSPPANTSSVVSIPLSQWNAPLQSLLSPTSCPVIQIGSSNADYQLEGYIGCDAAPLYETASSCPPNYRQAMAESSLAPPSYQRARPNVAPTLAPPGMPPTYTQSTALSDE